MSTLQIDLSGRKGLAPKFGGDSDRTIATPELRILGAEGQVADGIYNPMKRYGYLSPANNTFTDVTVGGSAPSVKITSSQYDIENNDFYFAEEGRNIWKGDTLDDIALTSVLELPASSKIYDLELYEQAGTKKLYFLYETSGGDMEIGNANTPFAAADIDWLSTVADGGFSNGLTNRAFMRVADDGFMYVFQDNHVHKINGTTTGGANGTIVDSVLQFPGYFQIIDAIDYRGKIYIALRMDTGSNVSTEQSSYNSKVGVYVWDRLSTVVSMRDFIAIGGVRRLHKLHISPEGNLRLTAENSLRYAEIRQFTGSAFNTIKQIASDGISYYLDTLTNVDNMTVWCGNDLNIYAFGKLTPGDSEEIYKIGQLPTGSACSALLYGGANTFSGTTGYKDVRSALYLAGTTTFKTWDMYGTGATEATSSSYIGNVYSLVKYLPQMSSVEYIDIYGMRTGTGSTVLATIKLYFNQNSTASITKTITRDQMSRGYVRLEINKQYINSIQIETEFSTSTQISTNNFVPSFAIVNYTPTSTKG